MGQGSPRKTPLRADSGTDPPAGSRGRLGDSRGATGSAAGSRSGPTNPLAIAAVGLELAGVLVILALGGYWLDGKWGTRPWFTLIGAFIGIVGGLYKAVMAGKRQMKDEASRMKNRS